MYTYYSYGLTIQSEWALPELEPCSPRRPDVLIGPGHVLLPPDDEGNEGVFSYSPAEALLAWPGVGTFLVRGGQEIVVDAEAELEEPLLRLFLLGAVLGALLHQRGFLVLHASAALVNGGAVAFMGDKGWGKSTTAAALVRRRHPLLADDLVALRPDECGTMHVLPGFSQLKLWPEAAVAALEDDPEQLSRVQSGTEKRARRLDGALHAHPVPLRRLYLLGSGECIGAEVLDPRSAFCELLRHTFVAHLLGPTGTGPRHLAQCAQLLRQVSVYTLRRPRDLQALAELAQYIEADLRSETGQTARQVAS